MEDDFFSSCASSLTSTELLHVNRSCLFMPTLVHCGNNVSLTAIKSDLADQISLINCVHTWTFTWWGAIQLQSNHESTRRCQAKDFDFSRHPRAAFDCWHFENNIIRCYCFSQRFRNSESQRYFTYLPYFPPLSVHTTLSYLSHVCRRSGFSHSYTEVLLWSCIRCWIDHNSLANIYFSSDYSCHAHILVLP